MPMPLKKGCNIHVEHIKTNASYSMRSSDVYTEFYGVGFIISGDRKIITPKGIYFSHAGDIGVMDMGVYHKTSSVSNQPYERYGVKFTPKMVGNLIQTIGNENFQDFISHGGYHLKPETQQKVRQIYEDMIEEYEHYTHTSELLLEGMLNRLLITIMREGILYSSSHIALNTTDETILDVLSYLDLHYTENPSICELAEVAGLSEPQFMKRFKAAVGSSYKTYLNCYKVRQAQNLLVNTTYSVSEIAEELGFCNSNYFSNVFHSIAKISPTAFRKSMSSPLEEGNPSCQR